MRTFANWIIGLVALGSAHGFAAETRAALDAAYSHEVRMSSRYGAILAQLGDVRPFSNLIQAEDRHVAILAQEYSRLGLALPRAEAQPTQLYRSVVEACGMSLADEHESVALYDRLLSTENDPMLRNAFLYLRAASAERHIPALERCVGIRRR